VPFPLPKGNHEFFRGSFVFHSAWNAGLSRDPSASRSHTGLKPQW
jgi:hypothetical protein